MSKKIVFNKYQNRAADYHWQQISRNPFRLNAFVVARYQQVVKLIPKGRQAKILDIGCGDGVLLGLIGRGQLYGIDLDPLSLELATTRVKAKFVRAPAEKLPFKNSYFDIVIATEIIEHLNHPQTMLREIKRVLKPMGRVIITTPVKLFPVPEDPMHVREFTTRKLQALLANYFSNLQVNLSHPFWLKKIYLFKCCKLGRFSFEPCRWLINLWVIATGLNPFLLAGRKNANQLIVGNKQP